jgi:hypothetical protein
MHGLMFNRFNICGTLLLVGKTQIVLSSVRGTRLYEHYNSSKESFQALKPSKIPQTALHLAGSLLQP